MSIMHYFFYSFCFFYTASYKLGACYTMHLLCIYSARYPPVLINAKKTFNGIHFFNVYDPCIVLYLEESNYICTQRQWFYSNQYNFYLIEVMATRICYELLILFQFSESQIREPQELINYNNNWVGS